MKAIIRFLIQLFRKLFTSEKPKQDQEKKSKYIPVKKAAGPKKKRYDPVKRRKEYISNRLYHNARCHFATTKGFSNL